MVDERRSRNAEEIIFMFESLEFIGFTVGTVGKVFISYTAIVVHRRFQKEHRVDEKLFEVMRRESIVGILGMILIVAGYFIEVPGRF